MPIVNSSKARLGQASDLTISPGDGEKNRPMRVVEYRQGNAK